MGIILTFLLAIVIAFLMGVCVGLAAFTLVNVIRPPKAENPISTPQGGVKPARELTDEEKLEIKKRQREIQNFFSYNGDAIEENND